MFILDINVKYDVIEVQGKVIFFYKMRNIKLKIIEMINVNIYKYLYKNKQNKNIFNV